MGEIGQVKSRDGLRGPETLPSKSIQPQVQRSRMKFFLPDAPLISQMHGVKVLFLLAFVSVQ